MEVGNEMFDQDNMGEAIVSIYKQLYSEPVGWHPKVDGLDFPTIDIVDRDWLERDFDREEVVQVLGELEGDKDPGPDGCTMVFFQRCWSIVEHEVLNFFKEFQDQGSFEKSLNATFIALIPKKTGAHKIKDFRPINLVGSIYKLLVKVLANRLRMVLDKVVLEE